MSLEVARVRESQVAFVALVRLFLGVGAGVRR